MNIQPMMDFLAALEANNSQAWFHDNKAWYQEAKGAFEALVTGLIAGVRAFDSDIPLLMAKDLSFRLMRDTRFSHDKRPYNPAFRAHIGGAGRQPIPCGYYICIRPGDASFVGGGLFASMFADATRRIREAIAEDGPAFLAITGALGIPVQGEKLKRVPREFDPALPQAEYLKHKSWYLQTAVTDELLLHPEQFIGAALAEYTRMKPFNDFLNRSLAGFEMPMR